MCDGGASSFSVNIQIGLVKEKLFLDPSNLSLIGLKRHVCSYIDEKFPGHEIFRLVDRLLIFRHDYASTNILQVRVCVNKDKNKIEIRPYNKTNLK